MEIDHISPAAWATNRLEHFSSVFQNPVICGTGVSEVYLIFFFFFFFLWGTTIFWLYITARSPRKHQLHAEQFAAI